MTTMEEIRKMGEEYRAAIKEKGKQAVSEELADLFKAHPELRAVRWQQYAPYFNDGDECVFSLKELYFKVDGTPEDAGDYEDGFDSIPYPADSGLHAALSSFSDGRDRDIYRECFGDHVEVTARPDGVTVEEYSHD